MKSTFIIFALLLCINSIAQTISLPTYVEGQYENDTVYTYYGSLPSTGMGSVDLGGSIASGFITGVDFKIVVDSTNQGASPTHAAYRDSLGTLVPVYQGDTLDLPASFQLYAGDIGFHIIIEGTPQIAGESYLCDLGYTFSTGSDWGMLILENTQDSCLVDEFNGLNDNTQNHYIKVFPNPFNQNTTIEIENYPNELYNCIMYDFLGKKVKSIKNISSNKFIIYKEGLPTGTYVFQLQNKHGIIATGKLIIE
ncbi:MAG: T9SS type A sorting domain-containing protein [Crocinitomicaceae bacterium]|nr:T9SS type A sorting domain-containing protein [Crocinitomicaceae bacterium]